MNLPSTEHLASCSAAELQELELAALNLSAQCMKRAEAEIKQAIAHREEAGVYRFVIDEREKWLWLSRNIADGKQLALRFVEQALARRA